MSEKRFVVVPLLGLALLLITLLGFAGTAPPWSPGTPPPPTETTDGATTPTTPSAAGVADQGLVFEATPRVRRVGSGVGEAPAVPGAFHFDLGVPVETVTRAFLSY